MPKKAGTRTAPSKKRFKKPVRFVTRAHRQEERLDEDAVAKLRRELKHEQVAGKGKPPADRENPGGRG